MKQSKQRPEVTRPAPEWVEQPVRLSDVVQLPSLQPRHKLSPQHVRRYAEMTDAGSTPPLIKVARVNGTLYLVDGWHRVEAGALQRVGFDEVMALVAEMGEVDLEWAAASANMHHGKSYDRKERRNVLRAFIKSKRHHKAKGVYMSYREMAAELGIPRQTLNSWVKADYPRLYAALGSGGVEDPSNMGGHRTNESTLVAEHDSQAMAALRAATSLAKGASSWGRWDLVHEMRKAADAIEAMGIQQPEF